MALPRIPAVTDVPMALAASAWVTTEQELKFPVTLAEAFFFGFGFALCFAAAAGADITVDAATATPRMLVAAIAPAAMIRRTVWPPALFAADHSRREYLVNRFLATHVRSGARCVSR